jgi:uncharacterized protein
MLDRGVATLLRRRLARSPAVALVGPRQCGKTTLAPALGSTYFDLEQPADQLRLDLEWDAVIGGSDLVIFDEAQAHPPVFGRLRGAIDRDRKRMGRFLLLGSVSPLLAHEVSESLAGRLALVELTPFLLAEVGPSRLDELWLYGGYPDGGILDADQYPDWQIDYLTLLTQRDLPAWGLPAKPQAAERLIRMLAAVHGQQWNASQVGQSLGISYHTVNHHVDYLLGSFLVRRLQPYQANLRKRLVKRPKLYVRDTGLLHAISNVRNRGSLLSSPWVGASWEGFVIEQVLGALGMMGHRVEASYLRTSDGYEIDLLLDGSKERWACEIKLTSHPDTDDLRRLRKMADAVGADRRFLLSRVLTPAGNDVELSCSVETFIRLIVEDGMRP